VLRLGRKAEAASGYLATATRPKAIPVVTPSLTGTATARINAPEADRYTAWLAGDWFGRSSVEVDGHEVGGKRSELNWPGLYTDLGSVELGAARTRSPSPTTRAACIREAAGRRSRSDRSR
jgi:hypothetical protein